jgi:hypothetical protein
MAMAGALRGGPVELVRCETVPLEVPATAEIVLEGEILPDVFKEEGPFGEYPGYYGSRDKRHVIEIKAITYRNNPIYQASFAGGLILKTTGCDVCPKSGDIGMVPMQPKESTVAEEDVDTTCRCIHQRREAGKTAALAIRRCPQGNL